MSTMNTKTQLHEPDTGKECPTCKKYHYTCAECGADCTGSKKHDAARRLADSAPELLEMVKEFKACLESSNPTRSAREDFIHRCNCTIAKATKGE